MNELTIAARAAAGCSGAEPARAETVLMQPKLGLYAVAAPFGGSRVAGKFVFDSLTAALHARTGDTSTEDLRAAILDAQDRWEAHDAPDEMERGLCCHAAIVLRPDHLIVAHMGHCGALLVREGEAIEFTRDHTARSAPTSGHPAGRPLLLRAFGMQSNPEVRRWPLAALDRVVLIAGIRTQVPDEEIARLTAAASSPDELVSLLVSHAVRRGAGPDASSIAVFC
jgi:serine/threonine protein phosphatase PrpC